MFLSRTSVHIFLKKLEDRQEKETKKTQVFLQQTLQHLRIRILSNISHMIFILPAVLQEFVIIKKKVMRSIFALQDHAQASKYISLVFSVNSKNTKRWDECIHVNKDFGTARAQTPPANLCEVFHWASSMLEQDQVSYSELPERFVLTIQKKPCLFY